jgi:dihydropteroate synthase
MGILNVTPDSFSEAGQHAALGNAVDYAEQMIADGVDIIDIGGESTRPNSRPVSLGEELDRVMPVVYALRDCGKPISVDTYKPEVMREVLLAGADMINDVQGFRSEAAVLVVKDSECGVCSMHMLGAPQTMQMAPAYANDDVVTAVRLFLAESIARLTANGVEHERILLDPGIGFGKTLDHNLALLRAIPELRTSLGLPILSGTSRKSMLGQITGKPVEQRLAASVASALAAVSFGASLVRVHDVAETVDALKIWHATHLLIRNEDTTDRLSDHLQQDYS